MKITVIGIAGPSGSGKTTISKKIHEHYGSVNCTTISSDNYYKDLRHIPLEERQLINFDHPNSIDFELLAQHVSLLKQEQTVQIPTYDFTTHSRQALTLTLHPTRIIIVEGILAQHPEDLARLYDTKIFVDTTPDICFIRRLERDVAERGRTMQQVIAQYKRDVKPMYDQFVAPCKSRADIIIENSDEFTRAHEDVCFDISPIIDCLSNKNESNDKTSVTLFFKPQNLTSSTNNLSSALSNGKVSSPPAHTVFQSSVA